MASASATVIFVVGCAFVDLLGFYVPTACLEARPRPRWRARSYRCSTLTIIAAYLGLAACSRTDDLTRFIEDTKHQPAGRVEPLPEIKAAKSSVYNAHDLRSPFMPSAAARGRPSGPRPDQNRNREFLEQYSLDTLRMVGTLRVGDQIICALVKTKDGIVHRVAIGDHLGQAGGVVTHITDSEISLLEIIPDRLGGYMERHAGLTSDNWHASLLHPLKR
jgi:type IV pilus assembly protein PilP